MCEENGQKTVNEQIERNFAELQTQIDYRFQQPHLLRKSLTHRSYRFENLQYEDVDNERLEFLGDSVLGVVVSHLLFARPEKFSEGQLSRMRAEMVNERKLATAARAIDLGRFLLLGKGEAASGGSRKDSILANALEAMIGAIFIDGGLSPAQTFVKEYLADNLEQNLDSLLREDFKTKLQEVVQKLYRVVPIYDLLRTDGPDHNKKFFTQVRVAEKILGAGFGWSKKESEQQAARDALARFAEEADGEANA